MPETIAVVDDDVSLRDVLSRVLERKGYAVVTAESGDAALPKLARTTVDAVLMDVHMPGRDGIETLAAMREAGHEQPVVIMSGEADIQVAVRAVREGAFDFIEKPLRNERVLVSIENALRHSKLVASRDALRHELRLDEDLLGETPAMASLKAVITRVAPSDGRVLITGENGTGKELVAKAIHYGSLRRDAPFIKVNCAAVPSELIESELFGHQKGAFTGAIATRKGKFELAHRGTLFLDEVGDMPAVMQAKLLRVLQEGEIEPVGAHVTKAVDVRVLAATNRDVTQMVAAGEFREDLFYRLNVVAIHVPPLRQRKDDIPRLVERFLREGAAGVDGPAKRMQPGALEALQRHDFPGNVRELRNLVERLVILGEGEEITRDEVELALRGAGARPGPSAGLFREGATLREMVEDAERAIVVEALARHQGNMAAAAKALGVERSHFYKKLKALGIERPS